MTYIIKGVTKSIPNSMHAPHFICENVKNSYSEHAEIRSWANFQTIPQPRLIEGKETRVIKQIENVLGKTIELKEVDINDSKRFGNKSGAIYYEIL